ncbi:ATP-dependent DNA helicase DDX11-like [Petromyzon marinus]|uniref:ATP-dependent DNA helicase DDX11-like n=1 Tax=Petromyzon marinus TaxID=7757 RepID=UPI003F720FA0
MASGMVSGFDDDDGEDGEEPHVTKIYYCSRTHSQLAQFVRELQRSPYGASTRLVSLGSRQTLCVNAEVRRLRSLQAINERCLELQRNKPRETRAPREEGCLSDKKRRRRRGGGAAVSGPCPYRAPSSVWEVSQAALSRPADIEELAALGKRLGGCPYYGGRAALPSAEVVVLPYHTLLNAAARRAAGARLAGQVVVIDEAHNLVDTITDIHSARVTGSQLCCAHSQLTQYLHRYRSRLKAKNVMYIKQILFVLDGLVQTLGGKTGANPNLQTLTSPGTEVRSINDFLFAAQIDNINLFKVHRYCEKSKVGHKLLGFVECYMEQGMGQVASHSSTSSPSTSSLTSFLTSLRTPGSQAIGEAGGGEGGAAGGGEGGAAGGGGEATSRSSPLLLVQSFLSGLTNANTDARVVLTREATLAPSTLKLLLLNPAVHFAEVLRECRAVVIAGGTMQPVSELKQQLLLPCGVRPERIVEFSCGHVIPPENILPIILSSGPTGQTFNFTFRNRNSPTLVEEAGVTLVQVCAVCPGGVVCFFPSYELQRTMSHSWQHTGVWQQLSTHKKIFQEPKSAREVDSVLAAYSCRRKRQ